MEKAAPDRRFSYETIEDLIQSSTHLRKLNFYSLYFCTLHTSDSSTWTVWTYLFVAKSRTKEIGIKKVFGSLENQLFIPFCLKTLFLFR